MERTLYAPRELYDFLIQADQNNKEWDRALRCLRKDEMISHALRLTESETNLVLYGTKISVRIPVTRRNTYFDGGSWPKSIPYSIIRWEAGFVDPGPSPAGNPGPYLKVPVMVPDDERMARLNPRIFVGDQLWVQETCYRWTGCGEAPSDFVKHEGIAICYADHPEFGLKRQQISVGASSCVVTIPAVCMPRWASRITLDVTDRRIERLQAITEEDAAFREAIEKTALWCSPGKDHSRAGLYAGYDPMISYKAGFSWAWDARYPKGPKWDDNPWVIPITFGRI